MKGRNRNIELNWTTLDGRQPTHLILSQSLTSSYNYDVVNRLDVRGYIDNTTGYLILSNSAGSIVGMSGALQFPNDAADHDGHIIARNSNLILTSSAGNSAANVTISGSCKVIGNYLETTGRLACQQYGGVALTTNGILSLSSIHLYPNGNQVVWGLPDSQDKIMLLCNDTHYLKNYDHALQDNPTLILHSSIDPDIDNQQFMKLYNNGSGSFVESYAGHLILSSAVGSVIAVSGNLRVSDGLVGSPSLSFLTDPTTGFWRSGASAMKWALGGVEKGNFTTTMLDVQTDLRILSTADFLWNARSRISCSADGEVGLACNDKTPFLEFGTDGSGSVVAPCSHLILSSSAGSLVYVSGSTKVRQNITVDGETSLNGAVEIDDTVTIYDGLFVSGAPIQVVNDGPSIESATYHLVLSCSAGSVVSLSASQDFTETDKDYHIRSANSHLILSSSVGSQITISGTLSVTQNCALYGQVKFGTFTSDATVTQAGYITIRDSGGTTRYLSCITP